LLDTLAAFAGIESRVFFNRGGFLGELIVFDRVAKPFRNNAVVNLMAIPFADRPPFCASLLPHFQEMRRRTGRPHWIVIDEAHHLLPSASVSTQPSRRSIT
jgi:hypothetical protein